MRPEQTTVRSPEMARLMDQVQQLLEARVLCMLLQHPNGDVSLTVPPQHRADVLRVLSTYDWSQLA